MIVVDPSTNLEHNENPTRRGVDGELVACKALVDLRLVDLSCLLVNVSTNKTAKIRKVLHPSQEAESGSNECKHDVSEVASSSIHSGTHEESEWTENKVQNQYHDRLIFRKMCIV